MFNKQQATTIIVVSCLHQRFDEMNEMKMEACDDEEEENPKEGGRRNRHISKCEEGHTDSAVWLGFEG